MQDVLFIGLILVLFAASVLLVRGCDRVVGDTEVGALDVAEAEEPELEAVP